MPEPARRTRARRGEGDLLRAEILAAAERLLLETGNADAVSIRAVAGAVGVTPPSIYLHFADKNELIFAVCEAQWARFNAHVRQATRGIADPLERVLASGRAYVEFGLANPEHYRILFMTRPEDIPPSVTPEALLEDSVFGDLVAAVEEAVAAGSLEGPADLVVYQAWTTVHGLVSLRITQPYMDWPDLDDLLARVGRTLLRGNAPAT